MIKGATFLKRVNDILNSKMYKGYIEKIDKYEENREYCRHDMNHFLTMARIAYIMVLEKQLNYSKEIIYSVGLLHDIGRALEYEQGIPHHKASAIISKEILKEIDFSHEEKLIILKAIENHRDECKDELSYIIYLSDKLSRNCIKCSANETCYWSDEKKNFTIRY